MARNVFRAVEIVNLKSTVLLESAQEEVEEVEDVISLEEYTGPTADDLRREAEAFKASWDSEKNTMIEAAQKEADTITEDAKQTAFEEIKKSKNEAQKNLQESKDKSDAIIRDSEEKAAGMVKNADERVQSIEKDAYSAGFKEGSDSGFENGKNEVERLIDKVHIILSNAIEKRNEIIEESETQMISLVLLISQKVIKVISENQKNVVINNVIQALRKLKTRGEVVVRVNLADVQLTTEHIKDFMRMVDNIRSVTVLEDSTVDRGGCIIETDFGEIDARISSQLNEIQDRILELAPIKTKAEVDRDFM